MSVGEWATLAAIWMLAVATPGPNVAFTVATGLAIPRPAAFLATLGIGLGGIVYAAAALSGLGALLYASPVAFSAVKWLGVAYLAYLGLRSFWPSRIVEKDAVLNRTKTGRRLIGQGFAIMISNPKAVLAVGAIVPPFIDPSAALIPQFLVIAATISLGSIAVHSFYITLAGSLAAMPWMTGPGMTEQSRRWRHLAGIVYLGAACALGAAAPQTPEETGKIRPANGKNIAASRQSGE